MKIVFLIPEEENLEIEREIPHIPSIDEYVVVNNRLYRITSIIHHMDNNIYEVTCGLEKVNDKIVRLS